MQRGAPALHLVQVCPPPDMPAGADASSLAAPWTDLARPTFWQRREPGSGIGSLIGRTLG